MQCKVPWDSDFITSRFTKTFFHGDLAVHRGTALFEREKALMPATQEEIRIANLETEMQGLLTLADVYHKIKDRTQEKVYRDKAQAIEGELHGVLGEAGPSNRRERAQTHRPVCGCIMPECRGFVMSSNWKCGVCSTRVCKECLKEDGEEHVCTDEDKDTRKLLLKDTKPCPKCGVMIHKTEGCSQMWCVMCHTTFNWSNCEIVTGYVHNPHYFEWMRRNGREIARAPGDAPAPQPFCGEGLVHHADFMQRLHRDQANRGHTGDADRTLLINLYRLVRHITEVELPRLQPTNQDNKRRELRIAFLRNDLSEDEYKMTLVKLERGEEKNAANRNLLQLFATQATEALNQLYNMPPRSITPSTIKTLKAEMGALAQYCNGVFRTIGRTYKRSHYLIPETFAHLYKE
jgi:hypothetical protein